MSAPSSTTYYDSEQSRRPLVSEAIHFWEYRELIKLLVVRDLTVRYKRSVLGMWWTLLNPLLTTAIMWLIFSQLFRFPIPGVPYVVYLLSGVLLVTYFAQGVAATGAAIVNSSSVLSKVYVPPEVFSLAAATAATVNLFVGMIPLLVVIVVTGVGVPWTVVLTPIPALAMLALITGIGLLVASLAVFFYDVLDLTNVFIQLIAYLTPSFYPLDIVPDQYKIFIKLNPLYHYLLVFRYFVHGGEVPAWFSYVVMGGTSLTVLAAGVWLFSRSWQRLVVLL
ncbi:MAG TPA: ABC transporter permease [Nitriliruptorales bacterium]|nr:ABC transporter permease [Nitriliruptorales bacterium]